MGCRLDAGGLSNAVHALEQTMVESCDAMILNKFGACEAEGDGFVSVLADAVMADVPTVIGVSERKRAALVSFVGAPVESLALSATHVVDWVYAAIRSKPD
ncbi:MAG: DUF2478 domain-containing protein [Dinoroseobacter sp.]|nr:DUF2478 domain-containing protein [Dinoroseobacter sp.]